MKRRQFTARLAAAALLPAGLPAFAQQRKPPLGHIDLSLLDAVPRFLEFYEAASQPGIDEAQRWALWKQAYDFNPAGTGDDKLREQLNAAWPRYEGALAAIKAGFDGLKPSPAEMVSKIGGALQMEQSLKLKFVTFVSVFDGAVITRASNSPDEPATLHIAVERYDRPQALAVAGELAHIVTANMGVNQARARTVAESVIYGGLERYAALAGDASLASVARAPGDPARHGEILRRLKPLLADTKPETLARVAGGDNDAATAGWLIVERWAGRGLTLGEIARTPPQNAVKVTATMIDTLLKK
jgi:hypothetical protein